MPRSRRLSWEETELFDAVKAGRINIVKQLIAAGVDVNAVDRWYREPLAYALDNYKIAKLLLDAGARASLMNAIDSDDLKFVKILVKYGVDVNQCHIERWGDEEGGEFPLYMAFNLGHFEIFKYLLQHGANVNQRCSNGETVPEFALEVYNPDIAPYVKLMLKYGANISKEDILIMALFDAIEAENIKEVKRIAATGVDLNTVLGNSTPLWAAAAHNAYHQKPVNVEIARVLIEAGADVNWKNRYGTSVLCIPMKVGAEEMVKLLIVHGAKRSHRRN